MGNGTGKWNRGFFNTGLYHPNRRAGMEKAKMDAQMAVAYALLDTIKEAGEQGAPSGPMYMAVQQSLGLSLDDYEAMMRALVRTGLVRHSAHCYYWIGEKEEES